MTPQERIAALELSNQRLRQALEYIREEYLFTAHGFHVASKALSSSEPSKVVAVLRRVLEVFEYDAGRCAYTYTRCVDHGGKAEPCCDSDKVKTLAALREILG